MKIGILTWYKELNHGALLQAYASQQVLKSLGENVLLLRYVANNENMDNTLTKRIKRIIKRLSFDHIRIRKKNCSWLKEKETVFSSFIESYCSEGDLYCHEQNLDKVMIGSDMVFDFYEGYNPFMYGKDVACKHIFTYAACFGYTTEHLLENYKNKDEIVYYLNKLDNISYRDDNTGNLLKKCGITEAKKTIDPVLLYGFENESKEWNNYGWCGKKYVLIYSYTYNMDSKKEINIIRNYAKEHNLEIISVGYLHLWCDRCINAGPMEFVELFKNASIVFTDTFHGTVFSLVLNTRFVVIVRNNSFKISDLLHEINLMALIQGSLNERIEKSQKINFEVVNDQIVKLRNNSMEYLLDSLYGAEKNDND